MLMKKKLLCFVSYDWISFFKEAKWRTRRRRNYDNEIRNPINQISQYLDKHGKLAKLLLDNDYQHRKINNIF